MICKKCKKDVPDGRYCIACGADQSASKKTRPRTRPNGTGTAYKRGSTWTTLLTLFPVRKSAAQKADLKQSVKLWSFVSS